MESDVVAPSRLKGERLASGFPIHNTLDARAGVDADQCLLTEPGRLLPARGGFDRLRHALGAVPPDRLYARRQFRQLPSPLADIAAARGADTIACRQQRCRESCGRYAADRMAVRNGVAILAGALGCAHPDRQQVASRLGDPGEIVEHGTPNWRSVGVAGYPAREPAELVAHPRSAAGVSRCSCGGGSSCTEKLISVDILAGLTEPIRP